MHAYVLALGDHEVSAGLHCRHDGLVLLDHDGLVLVDADEELEEGHAEEELCHGQVVDDVAVLLLDLLVNHSASYPKESFEAKNRN